MKQNEMVEVECQSTNCKRKVSIQKNGKYYGILCPEHMTGHTYTE